MTKSPFDLNRFELEDFHIYFLPSKIFPVLQQRKSAVLRGSRGTGKTTLLRALNWEEQLNNTSLKHGLEGTFASRACIGLYLKLTMHSFATFGKWLISSPELQGCIFSAYLDFLWIEALCDALAGLANTRVLKASVQAESEAVSWFIGQHEELTAFASSARRLSFLTLRDLIKSRRLELETWARTASEIPSAVLAKSIPLRHYGEIGRIAAQMAKRFCSQASNSDQPWHVKVCFDEAECLNGFQQKALNSAVRLTDASLSYVMAFVGMMTEPVATHIPGVSLQRADREFIDLDPAGQDADRLDDDFITLAEGVCKARIRLESQTASSSFSTRALLGSLEINALLVSMLRSSENPAALSLLQRAESLAAAYTDEWDAARGKSSPPIYQAYIIDRLGLRKPHKADAKERRRQDSAELRKKMVAAYLCICGEFGIDPRYAFAEMVIQASDRCLRDYLWQMDEIYQRSNMPIEEFCGSRIAITVQDAAMKAAADKKRGYVELAGIATPTETLRLIEALGRLTNRLQTTTVGGRGLRSTERGIFCVDVSHVPNADETLKIIIEAAGAGFLKVLEQTPLLRFRVHCSLAAHYKFSYRGAYYDTPLRLSDLTNLISQRDDRSLEAAIQRIEESLGTNTTPEFPLFEEQS